MNSPCVLGIDLGTTGARGILVDPAGGVVAAASAAYPLRTPKPGWAEQDPEEWWSAVVSVIRQLGAAAPGSFRLIKSIGLSGQMHSLILLDNQDNVLRPAILWCDTRTDAECRWINETLGFDRMKSLVANPAIEGFTLPKILWVRAHERAVYDRIRHVLLPKDYIRWRLAGELATEVADASGTLLFDVGKRAWSDEMSSIAGLPREWFPEVRESTAHCGSVSAGAAATTGLAQGIPLVGGGGDNACGAVGTGVVKEGRVLAAMGTSGVVFSHSDTFRVDAQMRLHSLCHAVPGAWCVTGVVLMAGGALRWYRDTFCESESASAKKSGGDAYDTIISAAEQIAPGSEGLMFLPYLSGERTPHRSAEARAAFIGATLRHTKAHFSRALLEGITFAMRDCIELMTSAGLPVDEIRLTGGGSVSRFWRQLQADVYGKEVVVTSGVEGAAFGAALLAAVGTGMFNSVPEAAESTIRVTERIAPDTGLAGRYTEQYEIYKSLYPSLRPAFHKMALASHSSQEGS